MKYFLSVFFMFTALSSNSFAASVQVFGYPLNWRLENYPGGVVATWFTGTSCNNGQLSVDNLTSDDKNRFFAMVLAAKLTNSKMFFFYDNSVPGCPVNSFGMDQP